MPVRTGYWIRVKNGQVTDVWDYKPDADRLRVESGWREAIEVFPDLIPNREMITTHMIDIDKEPAEIVWSKRDILPEERKDGLRGQAKSAFQQVVQTELAKETDAYPETQYDAAAVDAARIIFEARMDAIAAAVTHEDIDALSE